MADLKLTRSTVALLGVAVIGLAAWVVWLEFSPPAELEVLSNSPTPIVVANKPTSTTLPKAHKAPKQPRWEQLSAEQQNILRPLEHQWNDLSDLRRQRLLGTAKQYPTMSKREQERYSSRLLQWSKLTIEQRNLARKRYLAYSKLPQEAKLKIEKQVLAQQSMANQEPSSTGDPLQ